MEQKDILAGRIRDLSEKAFQNEYLTHTEFLSRSEMALCLEAMGKSGGEQEGGSFHGVSFLFYGGRPEADRQVLCFLPSYMDRESFFRQEGETGEVLRLLHVRPLSRKFADELTHRDFLGALMSLGIERDRIGDILVEEDAEIFVMSDLAETIASELTRVRNTSVRCSVGLPEESRIQPHFEELHGSVPSERLDAVLAMVFRLARGKAQELIEREAVSVDGSLRTAPGWTLKSGNRVSVRGYGKFIYDGLENVTRKGRSFVKIRLYQ